MTDPIEPDEPVGPEEPTDDEMKVRDAGPGILNTSAPVDDIPPFPDDDVLPEE